MTLEHGEEHRSDKLRITATKTVHGDPKAVGFKISCPDLTVSYTSDTEYTPDLHLDHKGADVLIASIIRSGSERIRGHMSVDDFITLINEVKPKLAIMTHLGMKFIMESPEREAQRVTKETGVKTLAARDGMKIELDDLVTKQHTLDQF